uniref:Nucleolar protein 10 n=1 Tax=Bos taurus TaxID=9913 RepID=A0AAA9TX77_BOVIN
MRPSYYLSEQGDLVYMLKKLDPVEQQTCSAHPARFSPNKYFDTKCFKVLRTQQPCPIL